jgi:hypothetical protein
MGGVWSIILLGFKSESSEYKWGLLEKLSQASILKLKHAKEVKIRCAIVE